MNIKDIISQYPYKTELHAHSNPVSKCGRFPADEVVGIYLPHCLVYNIMNFFP